jgi:hypothetical protein
MASARSACGKKNEAENGKKWQKWQKWLAK